MSEKIYDVCGVGNAILDLIVEISDEQLTEFGLEKASMRLVEPDEQMALLKKIESHEPHRAAGGSVANSIALIAQLGGKTTLCCSLGDDRYGNQYADQLKKLSVTLPEKRIKDTPTGTSLVMVTPDAERTMRTSLAASAQIDHTYINQTQIKQSKWVFLEGYLFANPGSGPQVMLEVAKVAAENSTKVAVTLSEPWVVESARAVLEPVVEACDLVFCNEAEAAAYAGVDDPEKAFAILSERLKAVVMTRGEKGVLVKYGEFTGAVEAFASQPVDLTGAGDALAGGFLYGISKEKGAEESAKAGCYFAHRVISQMGARLDQCDKSSWQLALTGDNVGSHLR